MNKKSRLHFLILAAYVFLTLVFTYPLGLDLNTHIPAYGKGGDAHSFIWNSWNFKKMVEEGRAGPMTTTYLLIPFQPNLSFHTYTLLRDVLVFLLSWLLPFIASFNLVTLFMFVASGFGSYLLALRFCRSSFAAFISGVVFSFAPFKMARLMAHYNFVDSAALPFFVILLLIALERKKPAHAASAGILLALIGYSSYYYLIFSFVFMTVLVLYWLVSKNAPLLVGNSGTDRTGAGLSARFRSLFSEKIFLQLAVMGIIFLILFSPILVNILKYQHEYLSEKKVFGNSPDVLQLVTPAPQAFLSRLLLETEAYGTEKVIFLGYVTILLTLYSLLLLRRRPQLRFWWAAALVFILLSLGSELIVSGKRIVGLPYQLLHSLPVLSGARNPTRYIVFAMLALGILSACSLDDLFERLKKVRSRRVILPGAALLLLLLICGEYLTAPLRMFDLETHDFYRTIAADEEEYAILELPFSISGKGKSFGVKERQGLYQYYQTVHQKKLVSGWLANLPDKIFAYHRKPMFIQNICFLQEKRGTVPEEEWERLQKPDPQLQQFLSVFNIRYIFIHRGAVKAEAIENLTRYLSKQLSGFTPFTVRRREGIIRFTLMEDLLDTYREKNLLAPENEVLLTEGWSNWIQYRGAWGRWAMNRQTVLLFSSSKPQEQVLGLEIEVPDFFKNKEQTVEVRLNSHQVARLEIAGRKQHGLRLPREWVTRGTNRLELKIKHMEKVPEGVDPPLRIGDTGVSSPVDIKAVSLSPRLPFEGRIMFPGLWIGNPAARFSLEGGYNLYVVDEHTGRVLDSRNFRTNLSTAASQDMTGYLSSIPAGRIVIGLTWDDASRKISEDAVEALRAIGAGQDIREHPAACHAVIGVKGAFPGQAMETIDRYHAALVLERYSNADKVGLWIRRIELQHGGSE